LDLPDNVACRSEAINVAIVFFGTTPITKHFNEDDRVTIGQSQSELLS